MSPKLTISVVIVTWNRSRQLVRTLNSILESSSRDAIHEVVVVDNASEDDTYNVVKQFSSRLNIIYKRNAKNIGCPPARNIGMSLTNSEFVYCLDDDGWLDKYAIEEAVNLAIEDDSIAIVCSKILDPEFNITLNRDICTKEVSLFSAGASLYRMRHIDLEDIFPNYFRQMEETHLAIRLIDKNKKIFFCAESLMYHERRKTEKQNQQELYYNFLNEFKNYKSLFGLSFLLIIALIRTPLIYKNYFRNELSRRFASDFLSVVQGVMVTKSKYKISWITYFKFYLKEKKSKNVC